jgi:hypothetical protein
MVGILFGWGLLLVFIVFVLSLVGSIPGAILLERSWSSLPLRPGSRESWGPLVDTGNAPRARIAAWIWFAGTVGEVI